MWHHRVIVTALTLSLSWPQASPASGNVDASQSEIELQAAQLENVVNMARELRGHINKAAFDLDALLASLDYDAEEIFRFVHEEIAFEQYPGLLRGPAGTLSAQAGNALDQSVLLAKLLRDAGFDARVAGARLSQEQASSLLWEMHRAPRPKPAPIGDIVAIVETLKKYSEGGIDDSAAKSLVQLLRNPPEPSSSNKYREVQSTVQHLRKEFDSAAVAFQEGGFAELVEEARDYHWVQFKDGIAGPWEDLHPAVQDAGTLDLAAETVYAETIPEQLQHRLSFQMFIEVQRGGRLEVIPISTAWERPVANLFAEPVVFGNLPDSMLGSGLPTLNLQEALQSAKFIAPVFRGQLPPGGQYFDLNGNVVDPMVASDAAAEVFKNVSDSFLKAAGSVGGSAAISTLTAQWVEYTFISPTGERKTVRRTTFDRIGPTARESGSLPNDFSPTTPENASSLLQRHTFMVSPGRTSLALSMDYGLERMIETYPAIKAMLQSFATGAQPSPSELKSLDQIAEEWPGHLRLFTVLDGADILQKDVISYRSGPALVEHREGLSSGGQAIAAVDIVANPRRSIEVSDGHVVLAPFANLLGGVWETDLEGVLLNAGETTFSTASAFDAARERDVPIRLLKPGDEYADLDLPPDALFHLKSDLSANFAVIVPESTPPGLMPGWWRVSLRTGETLGQLADGRGQVITEYLNALALGFSLGMLACGLVSCAQNFGGGGAANNARLGCCVLANFAMFGIGYLGGMLAAERIASTAALLAVSADELWDLALIAAAGSAAYDTMSMMVPACQ